MTVPFNTENCRQPRIGIRVTLIEKTVEFYRHGTA